MSFSFIHAADLHLDTPFEGLGQVSTVLRDRLVDASLEALDALVDHALGARALFVALAGDVYDGASRGLRAQVRLRGATERLSDAGIHTFIAHGNHDPVDEGWSAVRAWPERVRVFSAHAAETHALTAADGTPVTITGTSFPVRDVTEGLHARFPRPAGPGFHVAVLHANVGAAPDHAAYSPCRLEDLVALGYDAWLLGHIHRRAILRARTPLVAYPGNLQGRSFKPAECGPKGALRVDVDAGVATPTFIDLAPIRFEGLNVDVSACTELGAVFEACRAAADAVRTPGRTTLARGTLRGRTPAYDDLMTPSAAELLRGLQETTRGAPDLLWTALALEVQPVRALEALRPRDDLAGELVREMDRLIAEPDLVRRLLVTAAPNALRELLAETDDATLALWLAEAAEQALHLLEGDA